MGFVFRREEKALIGDFIGCVVLVLLSEGLVLYTVEL